MTDMTAEQAVRVCMERLERDIESAKHRGDSREVEYESCVLRGLRQSLTAPRVPEGWRDVSIDGYPKEPCQVLVERNKKTQLAAWIGDGFWYSNERIAVLHWRPLPPPPSMLTAAPAPADPVVGMTADEKKLFDFGMSSGKAPAPADATLIDEGTIGQVSDSDEIATLRERVKVLESAFDILMEEYDDRKAQFGDEFLWHKHEYKHGIDQAKAARLRGGSDE